MVGKTAVWVAGIVLLSTALAGCGQFGEGGGQNHITIGGNGQKSGRESQTLECGGGTGTIAIGGNGQGTLTVTVDDGDGSEIFRKEFRGSEQGGETKSLDGAPGTWTLTVDFGAAYGVGAWNGQYGITLTCSGGSGDA